MKNFEILKQMPVSSFATMVYDIVKNECNSVEEFEKLLDSDIQEDLEDAVKGALHNMQCSNDES